MKKFRENFFILLSFFDKKFFTKPRETTKRIKTKTAAKSQT